MPTPPRTSRWRFLRRALRWCRFGLFFLVLALLLALLYVTRVGLPGFCKGPLLSELRRRGIEFEYQRLAWHWHRGLVAQNAALRPLADPGGLRARAAEVVLDPHWGRLMRSRQVELESLRILDGHLSASLQEPGQTPDNFSIEGVGAAIRFLPGDTCEIENLEASFLGATLQVSGVITNAHDLIAWLRSVDKQERPDPTPPWRAPLRRVVEFRKGLRLAGVPEFRLRFRGDARHPESFAGEFKGKADGAESPQFKVQDLRCSIELGTNQSQPLARAWRLVARTEAAAAGGSWGSLRHVEFGARMDLQPTNPIPARVDWEAVAREAQAPWASFERVRLAGHSERLGANAREWRTSLTLDAEACTAPWGGTRTSRGAATLEHSLAGLLPAPVDLEASVEAIDTPPVKIGVAHLEARLRSVPEPVPGASPRATATGSRRGWEILNRIEGAWQFAATNLQSQRLAQPLTIEDATGAGDWKAPCLRVASLQAGLYGGSLEVSAARLDVATGEVDAQLISDFDPHPVAALAGERPSKWLDQFQWDRPPRVNARVHALLPASGDRDPDWARRALPHVTAEGRIEGENTSYRGVLIDRGALSLSLSNQILRLRDFHVVRPEGDADLAYDLHTLTQEFRWRLRANLDPKGTGAAINRDAPRLLSVFDFTGPAAVSGEVWGRWGPGKEVSFALGGILTNFTFRGESVDELRANVRMAHRFLSASDIALRTGAEWIRAPGVGVDFVESRAYVTNAEAELDPMRFARVIGSNLVKTLRPYRFDRPPRIHADGRVPIRGAMDDADMRFSVAGGPFHFWRFNIPDVDGRVHWEGERVTLTNVVCDFYEGRLDGQLQADIRPDGSADLAFRAAVTNLNLQPLVLDTINTTNRIEGIAQGDFELTHANSADWGSWNGAGRVSMRDGLLWNLPILSVLSPVLNAMVPGLGNNRARAATGSFIITNSVIHTDDLEIVAQPVRLAYRGTLDFNWNIRARVEAEVIPGAPLIGPLLNIIFAPVSKALIFRIGGTLGEPELEPLLVPRFLQPILRPVQTIRGVFSSPDAPQTTNAPPNGTR
ncbi:MAG TPA: AsmA-like C-terminal region-containing protein [Verrucomicrobiota bacterium]|nr:AsmA-like C-terminal region-containing protein [Verrucomicrobiota bacterium]